MLFIVTHFHDFHSLSFIFIIFISFHFSFIQFHLSFIQFHFSFIQSHFSVSFQFHFSLMAAAATHSSSPLFSFLFLFLFFVFGAIRSHVSGEPPRQATLVDTRDAHAVAMRQPHHCCSQVLRVLTVSMRRERERENGTAWLSRVKQSPQSGCQRASF